MQTTKEVKKMAFNIFQNTIIIVTLLMIALCCVNTGFFLKKLWNGFENKYDFLWLFLIITVLFLAGYGCMMASDHYSVDSFNLVFDMSPYWHMQIGRYVNCGVILLALKAGVNQVIMQRFFIAVWLVTLVLMSVMITVSIAKQMGKMKKNTFFVLLLAVSLSFLNVFAMELMLFPEMAMVFIPGNLALGLAVYTVLCEENSRKKWLLCVAYLIIALGSYQSYVGIFEAYVLIGIFFKWKDETKKRYFNALTALAIGGIISVFNVVLVKILINLGLIADSGRGATFKISDILLNTKNVIRYQASFWKDADGILPPVIMPLLGIVLLCIIVSELRKLDFEKKVFYILLIAGCYLLGFAPHLLESSQVMSPRSNIAVWSVIAVVFITGINNMRENYKLLDKVIIAVSGLLIGINCFVMQDMAANEQAMNAIDIMEAKQISEQVLKYENETGNIITEVAARGDLNSTYYQPDSRYKNWELGARIMSTYYSNYRLIGFVLNRSLERKDMPDKIYEKYFDGKDWNCLNVEEQMVLIDDTLYLAVY